MASVARETWTDERLDDLKDGMHRRFEDVDRRFEEVDRRFEQVDRRFEQVDRRFEQVDRRFEQIHTDIGGLRAEMNSRFQAVDARFDSLQRTIVFSNVSILVALIGAVFAKGLL